MKSVFLQLSCFVRFALCFVFLFWGHFLGATDDSGTGLPLTIGWYGQELPLGDGRKLVISFYSDRNVSEKDEQIALYIDDAPCSRFDVEFANTIRFNNVSRGRGCGEAACGGVTIGGGCNVLPNWCDEKERLEHAHGRRWCKLEITDKKAIYLSEEYRKSFLSDTQQKLLQERCQIVWFEGRSDSSLLYAMCSAICFCGGGAVYVPSYVDWLMPEYILSPTEIADLGAALFPEKPAVFFAALPRLQVMNMHAVARASENNSLCLLVGAATVGRQIDFFYSSFFYWLGLGEAIRSCGMLSVKGCVRVLEHIKNQIQSYISTCTSEPHSFAISPEALAQLSHMSQLIKEVLESWGIEGRSLGSGATVDGLKSERAEFKPLPVRKQRRWDSVAASESKEPLLGGYGGPGGKEDC